MNGFFAAEGTITNYSIPGNEHSSRTPTGRIAILRAVFEFRRRLRSIPKHGIGERKRHFMTLVFIADDEAGKETMMLQGTCEKRK